MAAAAVIGGLAALAALGWQGSERWMQPVLSSTPRSDLAERSLPFERVHFLSRDGTPLAGWFVTPAAPASGTVVLLHGLRADGMAMLDHAVYLEQAGYNVLLFDFRASGGSGGDDVTFGAREQLDALGALDYLAARGDVDLRRVGFQGVSMGGVVALLVAAADPRVAGVIVEAPFNDFRAVVEQSYAHRPAPLRWAQTTATVQMLNRRLGIDVAGISAVRAARDLSERPLLVIEDELDRNVPPGSAQAIFDAAAGPRQKWVVGGAAHGAGHQQQPTEYERRVLDFWSMALDRTDR